MCLPYIGACLIKYQDTIDLEHENILQSQPIYNAFILDEIQTILIEDQGGKWTLKSLIDEINSYNYEVFTFEHIFKLLYGGADIELNDGQIKFMKNYCKANFNRVDFRTALSVKRNEENNLTTSANGLAVRIWFCKRRFQLDLPESMLLDMLSFDWIEQSGYCGIDYLLNELDAVKVNNRIKQNLREGINIAPVLINHVEYCLKNNIIDILDDIFTSMNGELVMSTILCNLI